jgi:hypothetical protein
MLRRISIIFLIFLLNSHFAYARVGEASATAENEEVVEHVDEEKEDPSTSLGMTESEDDTEDDGIISLEEQGKIDDMRDLCGEPYPTNHLPALAFLPPNFDPYFRFYLTWKNVYDGMVTTFQELPEGAYIEDNKLLYTVESDDNLAIIADKFVMSTKYYSSSQLKNGILKFNNLEEFTADAGDTIEIPGFEIIRFDQRPQLKDYRGVYLTGYSASSQKGRDMSETLKESGGNLVIFDIKNVEGVLLYNSNIKLAKDLDLVHPIIYDLRKLVQFFHSQGQYAVARVVAFKDDSLAAKRPDLAIQSASEGGAWNSSEEGVTWLDASKKEVQDYLIDIAKEVAGFGVDEVQFDYIRFPAEGNFEDTKYDFDPMYVSKHQVLTGFLNRARRELAPYGVKVGIDVFGVVVWNDGFDTKTTGQRIECLSQYVDTIYPMIYPSHFGPGFDGVDNPADSPYFFVQESLKLFKKFTYGTNARVITWIQGFPWKVTNYNAAYVKKQVQAVKDTGYTDFAVWSANNKYDEAWPAF